MVQSRRAEFGLLYLILAAFWIIGSPGFAIHHCNPRSSCSVPFSISNDNDGGLEIGEEEESAVKHLGISSNLAALSTDQGNSTTGEILSGLTNVSYFYLHNELGLSDGAMWKITFQGSVLGLSASNIRDKVNALQKSLNMSTQQVRSIIERQPTVLCLNKNTMYQRLNFLYQCLGVNETAELREVIIAAPSILTYSLMNMALKVRFFTLILGFSRTECRELWIREPKLAYAGVRHGLMPRARFLNKEVGLSIENLRICLTKNPRILLYSVETNLMPKLIFHLILTLNMEPHEVQKLITSYPQYVDYNLDKHILPITQYFRNDLEYGPTELSRILLKFPRLMTYSLRRIKYVVGYLRYELNLTGSQVKRVLYQSPQIISIRSERIPEQMDFLQSTFQLSKSETNSAIVAMPRLMVLSIPNNLEPKTKFLLEAFGGDREALKATFLKLPTLLGYSLEKRIKPRLDSIMEKGLNPSSISVGIPLKEDKFQVWLHRHVERQEKASKATMGADCSDEGGKFDQHIKADNGNVVEQPGEPSRITHWTRERKPPFRANARK